MNYILSTFLFLLTLNAYALPSNRGKEIISDTIEVRVIPASGYNIERTIRTTDKNISAENYQRDYDVLEQKKTDINSKQNKIIADRALIQE